MIVEVSLEPEMEVKAIMHSMNTKDKNILDRVIAIMKYIKTIYICRVLLALIKFFS